MKSKSGLILLAALLAFAAHATDTAKPPQATAEAQANADAAAAADAAASATVGDVTQGLTVEDRRQAPASFAPAIAPTAPCYYTFGAAVSFIGGSVGGGKAIKDPECELREEIRLAYGIGLAAEARQLWCATAGKGIEGCGALTAPPAPVPEARPTVVVLTGESCGMSTERAERVLEKCVGK